MRKRYSIVGIGLCLLLAGCQEDVRTSGGDPLFAERDVSTEQHSREASIDILEEQAQRSEREQSILVKVNDFYQNLKAIKLAVNTTVTTDTFNYRKQQMNEEEYAAGGLVQYYAETETDVNGETLKQSFFLTQDEAEDKEEGAVKAYSRMNDYEWKETSNGRMQTIYLHLIKFVLEGSEKFELSDGLGQPLISKKITHEDHLKVLANLLDLPVELTPNAKFDLGFNFQVDEDKGLITNAVFEGTVEDLGTTYQVKVQARPTYDQAFKEVKVDLKQKGAAVETTEEDFLDKFKQGNLLNPLFFYETTLSERGYEEEQQTTWLKLGNYLNQEPHLIVQGKVAEEKLADYQVNYQNKLYGENKDKKVEQVDDKAVNYYANATKQFIEHYDALTTVEQQPDEETGEVTILNYRHQFESDYESFAAAAGAFDVSRLSRDEEALYGIDYIVDKATLRLIGVYYWSVVASDDSIQLITTMRFSSFNDYNPNNFTTNVPATIWEVLK
ncbi:hypothetical protein NHG29_09695 [Aerococcaceae bacterium NML160702]|nr:hypothetical protein [Aerococcaceae bacterium NML130460]MCW6683150.1 hypothetical protein [Aerococcaceae bacterium NML160702]